MTSKKYVKYIIIVCIAFVSYHFVVWNLFTSQIFKLKEGTSVGDLGRMSYQIDMLDHKTLKYNLPKQHINNTNFKDKKIDMITIGDSFSNGEAFGPNPYYQDFLANRFDINILNLSKYKRYNAFETIVGLYNSGYLAKVKPKWIVIESVERLIPDRYAKDIDFNIKDVKAIPAIKITKVPTISVGMINTANYKLPYYTVKYYLDDHAQKYVYKLNLNKKLFSTDNGNKILVYCDDISHIPKFTTKNIQKINNNFNKLAHLLKNLNIKLYFMPAPDKYDLYYDFITNNKYPKNHFFDQIRPLKKDYYFIDTKQILLPLLQSGVKDIYWIDDTHWTQKASYAIANSKTFTNDSLFHK
ncbi:hypothetical protein [Sulfurimonas sp. HSL3-2]|uniref:hypothetical protein n=1 Tax=Hydrocurvibacter mobilis TaxID=3131936 RepID=UPI0031F9A3B1